MTILKEDKEKQKKLSHQLGIGTKSQQALKLQHEHLVSEKKKNIKHRGR